MYLKGILGVGVLTVLIKSLCQHILYVYVLPSMNDASFHPDIIKPALSETVKQQKTKGLTRRLYPWGFGSFKNVNMSG